jgi:cytoskeletal protein RodZ
VEKRLKKIRISSGLEIDDISRATCITARYLKALEEGDFSEIPGDIYTRGYIKEYAKYLGVPFSEAIKEYEAYLKKKRNGDNNSRGRSAGGKNFLRSLNIYSFLNTKNQGS